MAEVTTKNICFLIEDSSSWCRGVIMEGDYFLKITSFVFLTEYNDSYVGSH